MEKYEPQNSQNRPPADRRVIAGLFILFIAGLFFLRALNFPFFPHWLFTWPMILIAIGIYSGVKHQFQGPGWLVLLLIGGFFLVEKNFDFGFDLHRFIVPFILFVVGISIILRPRNNWRSRYWEKRWNKNQWNNYGKEPNYTNTTVPPQASTGSQDFAEDYVNASAVFSGVKKIITSKNFKGGQLTAIFGGADIDLTQADINGTVVLDVTTIMGGAKLIVPSNWHVKSEVAAVLGGVDDKRRVQSTLIDFNKILLIKGSTFMGGIDIRSY